MIFPGIALYYCMVINLSSQHMYSAHYYDFGTLIRLSIVSPHPTSHNDPTLLEDGLVVVTMVQAFACVTRYP